MNQIEERYQERLEKVFRDLGLTEAQAKIAAGGRDALPMKTNQSVPAVTNVRVSESAASVKTPLVGDSSPIKEAAVRPDGTVSLRIIAPGWGSSGFYSQSVLERDGPKIFTTGLQMFWDHPTDMEFAQRPEGSLRDLAGQLVTDASWMDDGAFGPGLYADAKVFSPFKDHLDELAPHIGVSWRGWGESIPGEAEGRSGEIITQLTAAESVDFVTSPGAGGRILQVFESMKPKSANRHESELAAAFQGLGLSERAAKIAAAGRQ